MSWRELGPEAFVAMFEHGLDGVMFTVPDGQVLAANPAACDLLRRTEAEICALGRQGLADPTDAGWGPAVAERARTGSMRAELRMLRGDGTSFEADIASTLFASADGLPRGCVIIRDLSDRIRDARELALLHERDRVARDLHELVLRRVSAAMLQADAASAAATDPHLRQRLAALAGDLEATLVAVRRGLYESPPQRDPEADRAPT
jgi:PAS domain S-box-containing protein